MARGLPPGFAVLPSARDLDIQQALSAQLQGQSRGYNSITTFLTDPDLQDADLVHILKGLKECISLLSKDFETLAGVVLKAQWAHREGKVVKEYQSFIINLVSAHTIYLRACLRMIVKQFLPSHEKQSEPNPAVPSDVVRYQDERCFIQLHALLRKVTQIVPMSLQLLLPLLADCFPYITKDTYAQECYVRNLLEVTNYLPKSRLKVLRLVVDKMTVLDVRAPRKDIQESEMSDSDEEEEVAATEPEVVFQMDEDYPDGRESPLQHQSSQSGGSPMTHSEADRLDVMMNVLLSYIQGICFCAETLDWDATKKLYKELLSIFDAIILPTHASCHVQFIMFYVCSLRQNLCEGFLDYLWKKVKEPNVQPIFRQAAVAYMASLLARAKYIPVSTVKDCIDIMVAWIHQYMGQASHTTKPDVQHHGPFYSVCQGLFYVIAFRHKQLLDMHNGHKYWQSLNLQTIVMSRLNPLRICLPSVVSTFALITRQHQLAYCDTILERNRRNLLPIAGESNSSQSHLTQLNPLDSFFPFDPYLLSRSGHFIQHMYQEYEGARVPDQDPRQECTEEEIMDSEDADAWSKTPTSPTSPTVPEFFLLGTSPGFKSM